MKKIWGIWSLVFGLLLMFTMTTTIKADGDYKIQNYDVTADVQKNGDINFTQQITYKFDGVFKGVFYNQDIAGTNGITTPEIYVKNGEKTEQLSENDSEQENTFKLNKTDNKVNIKIFHSATTEKLIYTYKYRILGAVTNYSDTADLNWKIIGSGWQKDLNNVVLKVNLPQKNISKLQAWTHGPLAGYTKVDRKNGQVKMTIDNVPEGQFVETQMLFPTAVTADNPKVVNKKIKSKVLDHEKQLALDANAQRERKKWIYYILMALGYLVVASIFIARLIGIKRNPGTKHIHPTPLHHFFDEPKFLPSMAKVILDRSKQADSLSLTADLLNEVGKRRMAIRKVKKTYEITALVPPTNSFFKFLIENIGDGKKVTLKQIKHAAKGYHTSKNDISTQFEKWSKNAAKGREKYLDLKNISIVDNFRLSAITVPGILFIMFIIAALFDKNLLVLGIVYVLISILSVIMLLVARKKITPYTDLGEQEVNEIRAFKRMLSDIDDIKMAEVGDLILWEQFLPYAVVFGVSDKVIKALKVNFTTEQINDSMVVPYYIGANSFLGAKTGFESAFVGAISAGGGIAGSSSSISGGSGGFSGGSSGGFGGGSGGGAF